VGPLRADQVDLIKQMPHARRRSARSGTHGGSPSTERQFEAWFEETGGEERGHQFTIPTAPPLPLNVLVVAKYMLRSYTPTSTFCGRQCALTHRAPHDLYYCKCMPPNIHQFGILLFDFVIFQAACSFPIQCRKARN
jgi:hypothetical protein